MGTGGTAGAAGDRGLARLGLRPARPRRRRRRRRLRRRPGAAHRGRNRAVQPGAPGRPAQQARPGRRAGPPGWPRPSANTKKAGARAAATSWACGSASSSCPPRGRTPRSAGPRPIPSPFRRSIPGSAKRCGRRASKGRLRPRLRAAARQLTATATRLRRQRHRRRPARLARLRHVEPGRPVGRGAAAAAAAEPRARATSFGRQRDDGSRSFERRSWTAGPAFRSPCAGSGRKNSCCRPTTTTTGAIAGIYHGEYAWDTSYNHLGLRMDGDARAAAARRVAVRQNRHGAAHPRAPRSTPSSRPPTCSPPGITAPSASACAATASRSRTTTAWRSRTATKATPGPPPSWSTAPTRPGASASNGWR